MGGMSDLDVKLKNTISRSNKGIWIGLLIILFLIGLLLYGLYWYHFGPDSRRTMNPAGKTIEMKLPSDFKRMISAGSGGNDGDLLLTYENDKGEIITQECNRGGLFETTVIWKK